jgi:hypothetical protein
MPSHVRHLCHELETHVLARTGRRVRGLTISISPDRILLQGQTATYHIKQLAQHGVREMLPDVPVENAIVVGI